MERPTKYNILVTNRSSAIKAKLFVLFAFVGLCHFLESSRLRLWGSQTVKWKNQFSNFHVALCLTQLGMQCLYIVKLCIEVFVCSAYLILDSFSIDWLTNVCPFSFSRHGCWRRQKPLVARGQWLIHNCEAKPRKQWDACLSLLPFSGQEISCNLLVFYKQVTVGCSKLVGNLQWDLNITLWPIRDPIWLNPSHIQASCH